MTRLATKKGFLKKLVLKGGCSLSSAFAVTKLLDGSVNNLCLAPFIAAKVQSVLHLAFGKPSAFSGRVHGGRNENTDHRLGHHDCFSGDVLGQRDAARLVISGAGDAPLNSPRSALSPLAFAPTEQQSSGHFGPIDGLLEEIWDGSASEIGSKTNRSQNIH